MYVSPTTNRKWVHAFDAQFPRPLIYGPEVIKLFSRPAQLSTNFSTARTTKILQTPARIYFEKHIKFHLYSKCMDTSCAIHVLQIVRPNARKYVWVRGLGVVEGATWNIVISDIICFLNPRYSIWS